MSQDNTVSVGGKILRIIAVITGGVLLLGGGLAAYVGVKQLLGELNKPGGPDIETVAQCVVVAITLAIVAGGYPLAIICHLSGRAASSSFDLDSASQRHRLQAPNRTRQALWRTFPSSVA